MAHSEHFTGKFNADTADKVFVNTEERFVGGTNHDLLPKIKQLMPLQKPKIILPFTAKKSMAVPQSKD